MSLATMTRPSIVRINFIFRRLNVTFMLAYALKQTIRIIVIFMPELRYYLNNLAYKAVSTF